MYELGSAMSPRGETSLTYQGVMRSLTAREARGSRSGSGATPPALLTFSFVRMISRRVQARECRRRRERTLLVFHRDRNKKRPNKRVVSVPGEVLT